VKHLHEFTRPHDIIEGLVMQSGLEKQHKNNPLVSFCVGGACGLGAALAFSAAVVLAFTGGALGQDASGERAATASALAECESAAFSGDISGRAMGACDSALRSGDLSDSTRARVLANRGAIAVQRGEAGPAMGDLEEAVRLEPEMAEAWLSLSAARITAGRLNPAIEAAQTALALEVREPALAHFNIAIAHERAGRIDLAYDAYVRAAALAPNDATLQAQPGRFRRHQGAGL
jgi:tetratricopeptide (TPR) repeat protein